MRFKLDALAASQIHTLLTSTAATITDMVDEIGEDRAVFFQNGDWSGLDLRPCNLDGISFFGANLDCVTVYSDQLEFIRSTAPASLRDPIVIPRENENNGCTSAEIAYQNAVNLILKTASLSLTKLDFCSEEFSDLERIPDEILHIRNLCFLDITKTKISNINILNELSGLQNFIMKATQVRDISPLSYHTRLSEIFLTDSPVQNLFPLRGLDNLEILSISGTLIRDLDIIPSLPSLVTLYARGLPFICHDSILGSRSLKGLFIGDSQDRVDELQAKLANKNITVKW